MLTTEQKPTADILKRKTFKHTTREIIQSQGNRARVEETNELENSQKTINKMAISLYLSIITLMSMD